ncbi:hypothetical protein B0H14DRAFT_3562789 [Mycena olivaceomarginata]|nr:hypothetical protein B0H14DRAFT_3562789 [Mycena olivaceomarginata]
MFAAVGRAARSINLQIIDLLDNSPSPAYALLLALCLLPVLDFAASANRRAAIIDTERVTERSKDTRTADEIKDLLIWFQGLPTNLKPKIEKHAYRANTWELKTLPTLSAHTTTPAHDIGYYPASLCVLILWLVFVVLLFWLFESAVKHRPENLSQPWAYTTLPSLLITVFAQGHAAVTAMHLSHVSVSALHSVRMSPSTWAEVFWISDCTWQGPVGILSTFFAASRLRVRTSAHFVLCAVTCLTALVTSIILSRAYPIRTITVNEDTAIAPPALSIGTGTGSWTTALYALFYYLGHGSSTNLFTNDDSSKAVVIRALGYTGISLDSSTPLYTQPSLNEITTGFWRVVSYNVARWPWPAFALERHVEKRFDIAAYLLLATRLLLLPFIMARSFRPTFWGSFDSYITVKLMMNKPGLVDHSRGHFASEPASSVFPYWKR